MTRDEIKEACRKGLEKSLQPSIRGHKQLKGTWEILEPNAITRRKNKGMLRCAICDYTPEEGSDYADLAPGRSKVKPHGHDGEYLCDECAAQIDDALAEFIDEDETEE